MSPEPGRSELLVIGSGIAGLSTAITYARDDPNAFVRVLAKGELPETNTELAQGGIAAAVDLEDGWELHANDTLKVGGKSCDPAIVRMVGHNAPSRIADLIKEGVAFDRNADGSLATGREGGHTHQRILHVGDRTGSAVQKILLQKAKELPNLELHPHRLAIDLIVRNEGCHGAFVLDEKEERIDPFLASNTVLATGGMGRVYARTSNAPIATGDGFAMALQAGLTLRKMETVQFHPTAFYGGKGDRAFLISEAVRGEGARLKNLHDKAFAQGYDSRGELAPRKILSRAIAQEMERTGDEYVLLDTASFSEDAFAERFPAIHAFCQEKGVSPGKDPIPVAPAAHYCCGGIPVDANGRTVMEGLWACGEVSWTGLHGSDRLPSNSLLEGLVYGERVAKALPKETPPTRPSGPEPPPYAYHRPNEGTSREMERIRTQLRSLMSEKAGILRDEERLKELQRDLLKMQDKLDRRFSGELIDPLSLVTRNLLGTARAVVAGQNRDLG